MALVTDKDWIGHVAAVVGPLAPGELRVFPLDEVAGAKAWVTESSAA
jgi:hypothetical protein